MQDTNKLKEGKGAEPLTSVSLYMWLVVFKTSCSGGSIKISACWKRISYI